MSLFLKRIALLGADGESLDLARSAVERSGLTLTAICGAGDWADEARRLSPRAEILDDWESLLHGALADAVIVGLQNAPPDRPEQLRKLAQAGIPVLAVHPACEAIVGFELQMILRDTGAVFLPYHRARWHGAFLRLLEIAHAEPSLEQISLERSMADRSADAVLCALARDLDLLRQTLGVVTKVSAMGPSDEREDESTRLTNMSVNLTGANNVLARWSIGPVETEQGARLSLWTSQGKAILDMPESSNHWSVVYKNERQEFSELPADAAVEEFVRLVENDGPRDEWSNASRAIEAAEAARRGLRRGRTIELYNEEHSEEETFKGVMAVGGCGVLMLALVALLALATFDGLMAPFRKAPTSAEISQERETENSYTTTQESQASEAPSLWIRLWPAYPLLLFLMLQLLRWVALDRSGKNDNQAASSSGG